MASPVAALRSSPLRLHAFRRLALSYAINELGNGVGEIALAILVFDRTRSPLATAAMFVTLRAFPAVLAPVLTARLEIASARRVLPALYLAEGLIFGAMAALAHGFSLPAVLALSSVDGILAVTARALVRSTSATVLTEAGALREGNAYMTASLTIGGSIGPALGGVLAAAAGAGPALAVDAATFVAGAGILFTARELPIVSNRAVTTGRRLRAGLNEALRRPAVRRLLIAGGLGMLFGTIAIPIEVIFAKRTLHAGDLGYGLLIASWAIGMMAGSAVFGMAGRFRLSTVLSGGIVLIAGGYAGLAAAPDLAIACLFSVLGGVGNTMWVTSVSTGLQETVAPTARSAVMALLGSTYQIAPAIGYSVGGAVTAAGSPRMAYAVAAVGVASVLLVTVRRPATVSRSPQREECGPALTNPGISAD